MSQFWQEMEHQGSILRTWHEDQPISHEVECACKHIASLLHQPQAMLAVSDPRNMSRVRHFRDCCADQWSAINSRMEYVVAEQLKETCFTYADFLKEVDNHWFLHRASDLITAELELFQNQNFNLKGLRVCMIGPGAIPYTGLAMAAAGAHVTLVDMYGPACEWSEAWLQRFFPQGNWHVLQAAGQSIDYANFDLVIVASMLFGRDDVLRAIQTGKPSHVLVRTTSGRRPLSLLLPQVPESELSSLDTAEFVAESNPPMHIGNIALLYRYASSYNAAA